MCWRRPLQRPASSISPALRSSFVTESNSPCVSAIRYSESLAGSVTAAYKAAEAYAGHLVAIEIEVTSLAELEEALAAGARVIMLDNMDNELLRQAVAINAGRAKLEASGGVKLERVRSIAETGVDYISTSQITMGAKPLDLGLDVTIGGAGRTR